MVTRTTIIYSIAAAQRILNIKQGLYDVQEWAWVVWVRGKNFCRFMSKKAFKQHFIDHRKRAAQEIDLVINHQDSSKFTALGKSGNYQLTTTETGIVCTCEDYRNQLYHIGMGVCKHGYAVLNHLGFSSLSSYVDTQQENPRATMPDVRLSNQRPDGKRAPRGRSVD